ncbi:radical SAM protein [Chloroflexota bacterium]
MTTYIRYGKKWELSLDSKLNYLDIELTERCNNACIHCCINLPVNDQVAKKKEMPLKQIQDYLKQAADLGCLRVRFTGGEPLLRPDFKTIYEYTRRLGIRVVLFTNARLITPRLAQLFASMPPLEKIEVTVYGMHEKSYDTNAGQPGAFRSFKRGVQLLLDYRIPFIVKSVILPANRSELEEFEHWARTIPWMEHNPGYSIFFELRNRRDDPQKNHMIESLRPSPEEGVRLMLDHHPEEFEHFSHQACPSRQVIHGDRLFLCGASDRQLTIDAYGQIQACLGLRMPELVLPIGTPLQEALDHFEQLKEMRSTNSDYLNRCAQCILRNLCENCPAKAWSESGTLDTPLQYYCDVTHTLARQLGWLEQGELGWKTKD